MGSYHSKGVKLENDMLGYLERFLTLSIKNRQRRITRTTGSRQFQPPEILMEIFEYSDVEAIFRSLRLVCVDFFNITMDENFCFRYLTRNSSNVEETDEDILCRSMSFREQLLSKYYAKALPFFSASFAMKSNMFINIHTSANDNRYLKFGLNEEGFVVHFDVEIGRNGTQFWGLGWPASKKFNNKKTHKFSGVILEVERKRNQNFVEFISCRVSVLSYRFVKNIKETHYPHPTVQDEEIKTIDKVETESGLDMTDVKEIVFQVYPSSTSSSRRERQSLDGEFGGNVVIEYLIDTNLRPFTKLGESREIGEKVDSTNENVRKYKLFHPKNPKVKGSYDFDYY